MAQTIYIKKIRSPAPGNLDEDIDFICKSFGYFTQRDKQDSAGTIFRLMVKETCKNQDGITSDHIANELNLSRGAILHHLNNFIQTGLVIKERNTYRIRTCSLQKSVEEIKEDIDRIFQQILKIANDVDKKLGHYYR